MVSFLLCDIYYIKRRMKMVKQCTIKGLMGVLQIKINILWRSSRVPDKTSYVASSFLVSAYSFQKVIETFFLNDSDFKKLPRRLHTSEVRHLNIFPKMA